MSVSVKDLVRQPFGPFWDADILSDACKSTPSKLLELRNAMLSWNNQPTGLTECETQQPEYNSRNRQHTIYLRGVLEIKKLKWLSESGQQLLLQALRKRDEAARGTHTESLLTLNNVFIQKRSIRVLIQATKSLPAVHMMSKPIPHGLFIRTDDRGRYYHVVSMERETYRRSEKYLERYGLYRELRDVLNAYAAKHGAWPLRADRTPDWFLQQYLKAQPRLFPNRRSHSGDSDSDSSSYDSAEDSDASVSVLRAQRIRRTANATRKLFFTHGRWLVEDQKRQRRDPLIDPDVWRFWLNRRYRADATPPRIDFEDAEDEMAVDSSPTPSDDEPMEVDHRPPNGSRAPKRPSTTPLSPPPKRRRRIRSPENSPSPEVQPHEPYVPVAPLNVADDDLSDYDDNKSFQGHISHDESSGLEYTDDPSTQQHLGDTKDSDEEMKDDSDSYSEYDDDAEKLDSSSSHEIDSDFSQESILESDSDSISEFGEDDGGPRRSLTPTAPDVLAAIPLAMHNRIELPEAGDVWRCPVRGDDLRWCPFKVDLCQCRAEPGDMLWHGVVLGEAQVARLRELEWDWDDEWVQECLLRFVESHWEWHIESLDITRVRRRGQVKFVWKNPSAHPPSTHARVILRGRSEVKTEDHRSTTLRVKDEHEASSSQRW